MSTGDSHIDSHSQHRLSDQVLANTDQYWSAGFKVGIQHTGSAKFETTSERFRFDHKNEVIFGLNLTYTPAGN